MIRFVWFKLSPPSVSVGLTPVAATGAVAGVTPKYSPTLIGVAATCALGGVGPLSTGPLSGVAATGAVASFKHSRPLVGVAAVGLAVNFKGIEIKGPPLSAYYVSAKNRVRMTSYPVRGQRLLG